MTYSIAARDPISGQMGIAVQSHWFSVGSIVSWGRAGVGVVATQALAEPAYGPRGLELMARGIPAPQALADLLADDPGAEVRQVAMVDAQGHVGAHTGTRCIAMTGHRTGDGFSCQANMMRNDTVWGAMASAFESAKGPLPERLVAALIAAEDQGGDIRGRQSAALLVVGPQPAEGPLDDVLVDLRVEDHPNPVAELQRLLRLRRAYDHMDLFDAALEAGDEEQAWRQVAAGQSLARDNVEMTFWKAVALATRGREDEARTLLAECAASNPGWSELLRRLPDAGLFPDDPDLIERLLRA